MIGLDDGLYAAMVRRGMSRRSFLKFSAAMAGALALPASYAPRIAAAVESKPALPVIWLRGQDCAGNSEAFLGAPKPTIAELLLDLLSIEYHDLLMAPAGTAAEQSRAAAMEQFPGGYVAVVEGSIPLDADGVYCMIGGRPFADIVREVCDGALATIAVGSCAFDGGTPAAANGLTGATGVGSVVPDGRRISLPGCPLNAENLTATIIHYLTFDEWPATDGAGRPLFAYGGLIHNQCERRAHFEFGEFVTTWGDEASQKGWCLYKVGCKGPEAFANCPTARFASRVSWPVRAGTGCIGCTMPDFWDQMGPAYARLRARAALPDGHRRPGRGGPRRRDRRRCGGPRGSELRARSPQPGGEAARSPCGCACAGGAVGDGRGTVRRRGRARCHARRAGRRRAGDHLTWPAPSSTR